mgnify:CR=1 FL=1
MSEARLERLTVGEGETARSIAALVRAGKRPGLVWLCGFRSGMAGAKAEALDLWAARVGALFDDLTSAARTYERTSS